MPTSRPCTLRLLGRVELRDADGRVVALPTRKTALLLAMLALAQGEWRGRGELAAAVWEGADAQGAREGLRTALSALRKVLPPGAIEKDGDRLFLRPSMVAFHLDDAEEGDFMPGYDNDWALDHRLRLRAGFVAAAIHAGRSCHADGRRDEGLIYAERACAYDPLDVEAADLRAQLLRETGRNAEAIVRGDAFRARVVRELGIVPESSPPKRANECPLVTAAEWALARDPEEACALLAATQAQWAAVALQPALDLHQRVLAATHRPTKDRSVVESGTARLAAMLDPCSVRTGKMESLYRAALDAGEPRAADPLCEALAYGSLSAGEFDKAIAYAEQGAYAARQRRDAAQVGQWGIHLGIVTFHAGDPEACYRHIDRAVAQIEESGSALALLNAHNAQIGFWTHRGWLDRASARIDSQRRRIEAYGSERIGAWAFEMEAVLHERMGDLAQARRAYARFRELAPAAGQCAVATADDGLMRVSCGLREYGEAADALARSVVYRRRKGSVPSKFERKTNAPAVHKLRERLGSSDLATAFRRAASIA